MVVAEVDDAVTLSGALAKARRVIERSSISLGSGRNDRGGRVVGTGES
jgi:hypothetical protein